MATLIFQSLEELAKSGKLSDYFIEECINLSCKEVLQRFIAYFYDSQVTSVPEWQLISYLRCGQLVNVMRKQKDYESFAEQEPLKSFLAFYDKVSLLRDELAVLYSNLRPSCSTTEPRTEPPQPARAKGIISKLQITPKQLLSNSKKPNGGSAVILDIRSDQFYCEISVPDEFSVAVIPIPTGKLQKGLTFTELQQILPLPLQDLLERVYSCDRAVILADKNPPLISGKWKWHSHAHILAVALNELAPEKMKNPIQFLSGGFERWKQEYPCYVKWDILDFDNLFENIKCKEKTSEHLAENLAQLRITQNFVEDTQVRDEPDDYTWQLEIEVRNLTKEIDRIKRESAESNELEARLQGVVIHVTRENDKLRKELTDARGRIENMDALAHNSLGATEHDYEKYRLEIEILDLKELVKMLKGMFSNLQTELGCGRNELEFVMKTFEFAKDNLKCVETDLNIAKNELDVVQKDLDSLTIYKVIVNKMCPDLFCTVCREIKFKYKMCISGKHIASCIDCSRHLHGNCPVCRQKSLGWQESLFGELAEFLTKQKMELSIEKEEIVIRKI